MNCFICNDEFEIRDLDHCMTCRKCTDYWTRNKDRNKEYYEKRESKIKDLKKYRKQNLKYKTMSYMQAEVIIKKMLNSFGMKVECERIFFPYITDFYIPDKKCAIEIDGSVHDKQLGYDDRRDRWLKEKWLIIIIRFTNDDVNSKQFKDSIWDLGFNFFEERINDINFIAKELGLSGYKLVLES